MGEARGPAELFAKLLLRPAVRGGKPKRRPNLSLVLPKAASEKSGNPGVIGGRKMYRVSSKCVYTHPHQAIDPGL